MKTPEQVHGSAQPAHVPVKNGLVELVRTSRVAAGADGRIVGRRRSGFQAGPCHAQPHHVEAEARHERRIGRREVPRLPGGGKELEGRVLVDRVDAVEEDDPALGVVEVGATRSPDQARNGRRAPHRDGGRRQRREGHRRRARRPHLWHLRGNGGRGHHQHGGVGPKSPAHGGQSGRRPRRGGRGHPRLRPLGAGRRPPAAGRSGPRSAVGGPPGLDHSVPFVFACAAVGGLGVFAASSQHMGVAAFAHIQRDMSSRVPHMEVERALPLFAYTNRTETTPRRRPGHAGWKVRRRLWVGDHSADGNAALSPTVSSVRAGSFDPRGVVGDDGVRVCCPTRYRTPRQPCSR